MANGSMQRMSTGSGGVGRLAAWNLVALAVAAVIMTIATISVPMPAHADTGADQRALFEQAWESAGRGDIDALDQAIAQLAGYPLTPYLRFERMRQRPLEVFGTEMEHFLARHRDWSFADRLEQQWLRALARAGRDDDLLRFGANARDAEVVCRIERARLARGQTEELAGRVRRLWLSPTSQPEACDPLFAWWRRQGYPDTDTAWQRFGLAINADERELARYLRRYLDPEGRQLADAWLAIAANPARQLARMSRWRDGERVRRLLAWGLYDLATRDWQRAGALLQRLESRFTFTPEEIGSARRRIALFQAVDLDPDAIDAIDALPAALVDPQMLAWRARVAMAHQRWDEVLTSIADMNMLDQVRERWRYWRARALAELQRPEAGVIFASLSTEPDYYGFLAALATGQPLTLCPREIHADGAVQRRLLADAEFRRALELYRVGLEWHARWTFERVHRRLGDAERRQAALVAAAEGWHDRAIVTLARAGAMDAYAWRFPIVERELVLELAKRHGVEPALVMGMMRAESAMQADAHSPAGARGLLQLMHGTARGVARRNGLSYQGATDLYRPERNLELGIAHLEELQQRFNGDWTLVAAAYNAGISTAERWRDERPALPKDVWIETLSFHETRDYIPRVLAFATIYEWKLGRKAEVLARHVLDNGAAGEFACGDHGYHSESEN